MKIKNLLMTIILSGFVLFGFSNFNFELNKADFNKAGNCEEDCIESLVPGEEARNSTYSSNITNYDNYLTAYYDNLTYNFGQNYMGSCGYVALGMLLSYYDTYLNDNIVPEKYDVASAGFGPNMVTRRNSPGVLRDALTKPDGTAADDKYIEYLDSTEYFTYLQSMSEQSLHAKLITIGAENGYYTFNSDSPCGTNFDKRLKVLNDYLHNVINLSDNDYSFDYINYEYNSAMSSEVRNFTIEKVKKGYPVLLAISSVIGGHAVVAYDYDESTDKLFCHMGWGAGTTHVTVESEGFYTYKTALAVNFNLKHSHSNNYGVTTVDSNNKATTQYYCYDDCRILTYKQRPHSYTDRYEENGNEHIAYCTCGQFVTEEHSYTDHYNSKLNETTHTAYCVCGASKVEEHDYTDHHKNTNLYHIDYCECGKSQQGMHRWGKIVLIGGIEYAVCSECDLARKVGNGFYPSIDLRL